MITVNNAPQIVAHLIAEAEVQQLKSENQYHYDIGEARKTKEFSEDLFKRAKQIDMEFGVSLRERCTVR